MRGWIIPIGGKLLSSDIFSRFVELSGGGAARIAVIATASNEPDMGAHYEHAFQMHGVRQVKALGFHRRSDCDDRDWLRSLGNATGVFLSGGNQLKLSAILGGTRAGALLRELNSRGVHVAGTSAGAAYLSEHMIAYGAEGSTPRAGMVGMCAGLGLTNRVIIDQHFRERNRIGRLLTALSYNPFCCGLGVDEDTAAFIDPDDRLQVEGTGAVTVVDTSNVTHSSIASTNPGEVITFTGAVTHLLHAGSTFDLRLRDAETEVDAHTFVTLGRTA